ncbi:MAG: Sugar (and other) transporter, partial [Porphyrobacter sp. HL-46]
PKDFVDD